MGQRNQNAFGMSNIEQSSGPGTLHYLDVKTADLTPKQTLSVPCPTCGAAIGEVCELHSGAPRTESHRDRKLTAAEAVETAFRKRKEHPQRRGGLSPALAKV